MHRAILPVSLLLSCATALSAQTSTSAQSFELLNNGYFISVQNIAPAEGDFNNDGKPDFVTVGNTNTNNSVNLMLGDGLGHFQKPVTVGNANSFIQDMAVADFNNDGNLDIVTFDTDNNFSVFYGNGNGTFQKPVVISTDAYPVSGTVGQFFGDGYTDVALADGNGDLEIFRNDGGKNFVLISTVQAPVTNGTASGFQLVRAGAINGNATSDLAALTHSGAYVLWNNGRGNFTKVLLSSYTVPEDLSVAQVAQDGRSDIMISYSCAQVSTGAVMKGNGSICSGVDVYYGQGASKVTQRHAVTATDLSQAYSLRAVDVNGDGIADIVASAYNGSNAAAGLYIWLGNPDGSFSASPQSFDVGDDGALVAGDFNRDGAMDFVQLLPGNGTFETYLNGAQIAPCATSKINFAIVVCQPVNDTYVGTPHPAVTVQATASDHNKLTAMQVYVDGQLDYSEDVNPLTLTTYDFSPGQHSIVVKGWDSTGISFMSPRTIYAYSGDPGRTCPAALGTASMCLPASTLQNSQVLVLANGYTPNIPTAAQLYVDGKLVVNDDTVGDSAIQTTQTLTPGDHSLVFKLWDSQGKTYIAERSITVQ